MKKGFVITENFRRLADAEKQVAKRGAREAGLVIIQGPFGVGKSDIVERWAADNNAHFLRCMETWTKRALLDALAERMGLDNRGRNSEVQARIIGRLAVDMSTLIFDEADFLIRSTPALLEVVRDITDTTGVVCMLVGMQKLGDKIARFGHIASRVARVVNFERLPLADVAAACSKLADMPLSPDVVAAVHAQSDGRMRLVLNAIANIEEWAKANGWKDVRAEHVKGRPLCVEFKGKTTGRAPLVGGGL
jgi:DNA transposition AAA+ family ATPase